MDGMLVGEIVSGGHQGGYYFEQVTGSDLPCHHSL